MPPLRQRMIDDLQLRGLSDRTQERSVRAVRQLADHDHKSPDRITEAELRDSLLYRKHGTHYSRAARPIARCGITFCYEHTLTRDWTTRTCVRALRAQTLPVVLSVEAVRTSLQCVRLLRYRVCLSTLE